MKDSEDREIYIIFTHIIYFIGLVIISASFGTMFEQFIGFLVLGSGLLIWSFIRYFKF
jgi:hypothetical protein